MFQDKLTREIAAAAAQIKTEPPKNEVNTKSVEGAVVSIMANEELKGNQHKIDANKNGKVDAHDFKLLRAKKGKTVEEGIKGAGIGAAVGSVAGGPVGAAIGGALGHVAGEVLSSAKNKTKAMYRIAKGPSMADSKMKREEVEQLDEIGDTKEGRKMISSYVNKAIGDKNREKGLRKATSRLYKDNFYGKKNEEVEMSEEDAYSKDRYAVKDGKAKKDNPTHMGSPNYKDQPHHVWATSAEHALKKSMKKEEVEELDELFGKGKLPAIAAYHKEKGAEAKGKMETIRSGNTKLPVPKSTSAKIFSKDAESKYHSTQEKRAKALMKKEETEQLDELMGKGKLPAIAAYHKEKGAEAKGKMETIRNTNTTVPVPKEKSAKIFAKDAEAKYHSTQEKRAKSLMKKEEVEQLDEIGDTAAGQKMLKKVDSRAFYKGGTKSGGKANMADAGEKTLERTQARIKKQPSFLSKAAGAVKKVLSREQVEDIFNSFMLKDIQYFMVSEEFEMLDEASKEMFNSYLEQIDEAFPTVADAKKRMAAKESGFEKKKISTGTVYSRKYKSEPEENEEMPKKKAKTMKEMLEIYSNGGAEALVENLMIEEPSQDEYKKEVDTAHAKAEGKIRNDKGVAKAASQGVKMEEVEIEVYDADEINGVQVDTIDERHMTDAEMNKREKIVKSMKKGIQGFKDRYGDRAKDVMYATATKQAMKEDAESVDELYNPVTVKKGVRRNVDSSGKVSYSGGVRVKGSGASSAGKVIGHQMDVEKRAHSMWKQKHPILSKIKSAGSAVGKAIDRVAAIKIGNKNRAGG